MHYEVRELKDVELEVVAGGMDCATAFAAVKIDKVTSLVLDALGDHAGSRYYTAEAEGIIKGACGPA